MSPAPYSLMIHGGAGLEEYEGWEPAVLESLGSVLARGEAMLSKGATALDVAEACCRILEDDPLFNAGKGAVLNDKGEVELDASIMSGIGMEAGAIAGVRGVRNPVSLARAVMEQSPHVLLAGEGAMDFARAVSAPTEPPEYFIIDRRRKQWEDAAGAKVVKTLEDYGTKRGTVGVVARDRSGNLAAATSTGGIVRKRFGRVGDCPIIGAGVYADNETCAVSATGYGEQFLRTNVAKVASDLILFKGLSAPEAARDAIAYLVRKVQGVGGIILIDKDGNCGSDYSDTGLSHAWVREGGIAHVTVRERCA